MNRLLPILLSLFLFSCASQTKSSQSIKALTFLGEADLPYRLQFNGTTVGGLSGIDYVPAEDLYYLISDDRSDINPARFYTAKIGLSNTGINAVQLVGTTTLLQRNGLPFPNKTTDSLHVPDPEALRYNASNGTIVWSSEGERIVRKDRLVITDPAINIIDKSGRLIDSFPLPENMHMSSSEKGPRQNGVFEGLAFADSNKTLYVSVEEPIYEDGPRAGLGKEGAWTRIIKYDVGTKKPLAQYAYKIDPVQYAAVPSGSFMVNGVPDILAVNDHQLLVTERSFSTGRSTSNIRVYLAELKGASDISMVSSLQQTPPVEPVKKKLLFNMDALGRWIDNIEGATFGPLLPNGKRSLIFVSDDNFSKEERTQFLLFSVN